MYVDSFRGWATRAIPQTSEEECIILVGRGAASSLSESQGSAQFTYKRDFTIKGLPLTLSLTCTNILNGAILAQEAKGV